MIYGWRFVLSPLWALCIAGALLIAFFSFGWYDWSAFVTAGVVGLIAGVPAGVWNARKLRRDDEAWPREA